MSQPFIGEIRMFPGNFAPVDWAICDGSLLSISANPTLFQLIGTTYGGDGQTTYALPDLRSRTPIHMGGGYILGANGGTETVTLLTTQIPAHSHVPLAAGDATVNPVNSPANAVWAGSTGGQYSTAAPNTALNAAAVPTQGGSQPHDNMIPFLAINFIISLYGIFPTQT